jgi:hypothetical protein
MFQAKVVEREREKKINNFFYFENRAVYEIMWRNTVDLGRSQKTT